MPTNLVITALNIRSLNINNPTIFHIKLEFYLSTNSDVIILSEINAHKSDVDSAAQK